MSDLDDADRVTYRVEQTFRYDYDSPVTSVRQRLICVPRLHHGDQHRRRHRLSVHLADGPAVRVPRRSRHDRAGNSVLRVLVPSVSSSLEFRLVAELSRVRSEGPGRLPATALHDPLLLRPTHLTTADDRVRDLARSALRGIAPLADPVAAVEAINHAVRRSLVYRPGATGVRTTAAEALALGAGVCQDYAHVMLAVCRTAGIPARYVSGHLIGEGATHAWVETIVPAATGAVALAFDPCNDRRAGNAYITVATGRDYADIPPTSGTYVGAPGGRLTSSQTVHVLDRA
ncbi:transglutaminase family protein [Catenuloplanes atrovinosus]|uniref:Transglutaminase-like putative cysteine protease n=1 Tax=Catenuloplanes atrovinosus TaxID=137266 RepID=A0AAE4C7J7_9ACTN|nr:transglutaminase family protein [Catenuloplanes atrovinosus]MDR7273537.1 transglutaminase-like putative cysteine protease [Catenuloplanes atrovinosus]